LNSSKHIAKKSDSALNMRQPGTSHNPAAAWGTAADVRRLLQMNASAESRTYKLAWTPLFCAVCFKNIGTLQELWNDGDELEVKEQQDVRGWNLLHVAVGYGKFEAVPYLLEQGVSLEAISKPASRLVPPSVQKKCDSCRSGTELRRSGILAVKRSSEDSGM
jgi:ankyrin repeat protein